VFVFVFVCPCVCVRVYVRVRVYVSVACVQSKFEAEHGFEILTRCLTGVTLSVDEFRTLIEIACDCAHDTSPPTQISNHKSLNMILDLVR
jgi:hypothetical protein